MTRNDKYCLALAAMLLASCNNEEVFGPTPGGNTSGSHEVRLTIPGVGSGAVPYSIATESENKLEDFDVYVFGMDTVFGTGNYLLEEVFRSRAGLKLDDHGTSKTATIQLKGTNAKRLYYVANSWREGVNTLSLDSVELNKTTTTEFRRKLTDPIPVHLACPLLMTDSSVIADPVTTNALTVELKRSMARFDIINNTYDTEFRIDWVEVEKARQYAYIFPQKPAYAAAPVIDKMERIDFKALHNANKGETNSVFYMYPTVVDGEASVSLGGERSNAKVIYPVKLVKADKTTPLPIEANKRYVIEVLSSSVAYIDATIRVVDWLVGDTTRSEAGDGTIKLSLHKGAVGDFNDNTLVIPADVNTFSTIDVECDSEWEFADADLPSWIKVDTAGFSLNKVAKSFKLTAKNANPSGKTQRVGTIMLRNVRHPAITQPLVVKQKANAVSSIDLTCSRLAGGAIRMTGAMDSLVAEVELGGTAALASYTYEVTTNTWLTVEPSDTELKADGKKYLKFKAAAANATNDTLRATVTLKTDDGLEQIIKVTQAPQVLNLIATASGLRNGKLTIGSDAKDTKVTIEAQDTEVWTVTKENVTGTDDTWLTLSATTGAGNGSFDVQAAKNTTADDRAVLVTVSYKSRPDIRQMFVVTQTKAAVVVHDVTVDYETVAIAKNGTITDNAAITVTTSPDTDSWKAAITGNNDGGTEWVTIDKTTGANNGQIALTAGKENTTGSERKATITITNDEDDTKTTTVTITQEGI